MTTEAGIELTEEEVKLVKALKSLAKKWKKHGEDLWLFSAGGSLTVMMRGSTRRNSQPEKLKGGGANSKNAIITIDIPNSGGDW